MCWVNTRNGTSPHVCCPHIIGHFIKKTQHPLALAHKDSVVETNGLVAGAQRAFESY